MDHSTEEDLAGFLKRAHEAGMITTEQLREWERDANTPGGSILTDTEGREFENDAEGTSVFTKRIGRTV